MAIDTSFLPFPLTLPPQISTYLGPLLIIIGLVMAFAGKLMFRSLTSIIGSFLGASLGFALGSAMGGTIVGFLAAAVGALLGGAFMRYLVKFGLAVLLGFLAFLFLGLATRSLLLGAVAGLVVFILVIYFMDEVLLLLMAAGGGLAVAFGVWLLTLGFLEAAIAGVVVFLAGAAVQSTVEKQRKRRSLPLVRTVVQPVYIPMRMPPARPPPPPPPPPPYQPPGQGPNFYPYRGTRPPP